VLDFLDQCEELAASYGVLPQVILNMPWRALKRLLQSFNKRQRRELRLQAAMRGLDGMGLFSGSAGTGERDLGRTDVDIESTFAAMQAAGFPVKER
jgi:hypothetical protein